jgi:hypothetical protein
MNCLQNTSFRTKKQIQGISEKNHLSPENLIIYLPGAGAGDGASAGFSGAGAGAGAVAGASFVASGFGVSAGLQPTLNTANNINDNTNARTFFIKFSPPSEILNMLTR